MISSLRGRVLHLDTDLLIVEVGGVGFSVAVTPEVVREFHLGDEIVLHTTLIVREDALSLFGFREREELTVFTQLLSVSGVGPKSALGVLAALSVPQIADAVNAEDDAPFRRVSGIGPKTAKLIVVQLAGKLTTVIAPAAGATASPSTTAQVAAALVALGWNERTSVQIAADVVAAATPAEQGSVPALLRSALAQLGPARTERTGV
ncbi:Holliday junction branch migration protein RuvA [Microbacterium memoriense]|uniref:Holliday junction branch migration complex subunit RuvA n=1 Tax=Microbacterium memoriense TaxID=2978350 RepID=A0ABT2PAD1_9MICO|nr:Holliday junction branch migration protein RuvA [Microbacterium memoriense]MCT9000808.1 Holliday junction branch migration protein RuvA [Microbacterium memoriense]